MCDERQQKDETIRDLQLQISELRSEHAKQKGSDEMEVSTQETKAEAKRPAVGIDVDHIHALADQIIELNYNLGAADDAIKVLRAERDALREVILAATRRVKPLGGPIKRMRAELYSMPVLDRELVQALEARHVSWE